MKDLKKAMEDLTKAARADNIDMLYTLITTNPRILEDIDDIPFVDTPLHVATKCGSTHFAMEILRLKPSFGRKLNQDGLSPLDLALHNGCVETVRRLIEIDGQLVRVKGKESLTLLHHVVKTEQVELLAQILIRCPMSISDLTIWNENALHIAAANGNSEALYVLIGWLKRTDNRHVLRCKDEHGNTLLHIVASNYEKYTIHSLPKVLNILSKEIAKSERNTDGKTAHETLLALQCSDDFYKPLKKLGERELSRANLISPYPSSARNFGNYLASPQCFSEKLIKAYVSIRRGFTVEMVNTLLVVATLIAVASYQAALTPPTGLEQLIKANPTINLTLVKDLQDWNSVEAKQFSVYSGLKNVIILTSLTFSLSMGIIIFLVDLTLISVPVHITLYFFTINFSMVVLNQEVDFVAKKYSLCSLVLCYAVYGWKVAIFLLQNKAILHCTRPFIGKRLVSRLEMQELIICRQ